MNHTYARSYVYVLLKHDDGAAYDFVVKPSNHFPAVYPKHLFR